MKHRNGRAGVREDEYDFFKLDPARLIEEWMLQPQLMWEYGDKLADARAEARRAKAAKELVEAELNKDIRLNPESYGLEKVTDKAVEAYIILQAGYQVANEGQIKAEHRQDQLYAAVEALQHRKAGLENAVKLLGLQHFAEPRVDKDNKEAMGELEKKHTRKLGQKKR